jgi:hypothetical protein
MSRFTCIRYDDRDIYLEEPVPTGGFHPQRVDVLHDGLREDELPEDACPICVDDLPQGAWNDYVDPDELDEERAQRDADRDYDGGGAHEGDDFRERFYPRLAPR